MNARVAVLGVAFLLVAGPALVAADPNIKSRADVDGAVVNLVDIFQGGSHSSASSCQLMVAGDVFVGATAIGDALKVIDEGDGPVVVAEEPVYDQQFVEFSNATSACSHFVGSLYMEIERDSGWGEASASGSGFWPRGPPSAWKPGTQGFPLLDAEATMGDIAANNATVFSEGGPGNAASVCQLLVAAEVTIVALAIASAQASVTQAPPVTTTQNNELQDESESIATCDQRIVSARIVLPG